MGSTPGRLPSRLCQHSGQCPLLFRGQCPVDFPRVCVGIQSSAPLRLWVNVWSTPLAFAFAFRAVPPFVYGVNARLTSLAFASAFRAALPFVYGVSESNDPGVAAGMLTLRLPCILIKLYAWFHCYILRDPVYASLVDGWHVKDRQEFYHLVGQRECYRTKWFEYWKEQNLDLVLTMPNVLPAMRHGDSGHLWKACGYTFLFNIVGVTHLPLLFTLSLCHAS